MKLLKALPILAIVIFFAWHTEKKVSQPESRRIPTAATPIPLPIIKKEVQEENFEKLKADIEYLSSCYEKSCGRKTVDPRTDFYNLGRELKIKLIQYENYVSVNKLESDEISNFALQYLSHPDGHIQEVALDILSTQEINESALDTILENIINGNDAELIHQALMELQRYKSADDQKKIRNTLGYVLKHGTPFVAVAIADSLGLVLTAQNVSYFEELIKDLDPQSKVYQSVLFSIQEFDQKSQAG